MLEYDVDMKEHKATNIRNAKMEEMDLILCATRAHKNAVQQMYPNIKDKIYTMKEYVQADSEDLDIRDPWGYDIETYRFCASEIDDCLNKLIKKI